MRAIILADSEGNRLRPITCTIPKAMIPVAGKPVCERLLRLLKKHDIREVSFLTSYLSQEVKDYFSHGNFKDIKISFIGSRDISGLILKDDCLLISGSIVTDFDFSSLIEFHAKSDSEITLVSKSTSLFPELGTVKSNSEGNIVEFSKPEITSRLSLNNAFTGIMMVSQGTEISKFRNISTFVSDALKKGYKAKEYLTKEYVFNINDLDSYFKVTRDVLDKKSGLNVFSNEKESGVFLSESAIIEPGCVIVPPVFIGNNVVVKRNSRIEAYTVLGDNVIVEQGCTLKRSIIMENAFIGAFSNLRSTVICKNASTNYESASYEGSILGYKSNLGKHCIIHPGARIWPEKDIEDESVVSTNIIWGSVRHSFDFEHGYVSGIMNREITPEFACKLGFCAGKLMGNKIAVSSGRGGSSAMIKNALCAGIQSSGSVCFDFGEQPLPITRSGIKFYSLDGGLCVSTKEEDGSERVSVDIVNSDGANIEKEKLKELEVCFYADEFQRALPSEIAESEYLFEYKLYYLKQLINSTSKNKTNLTILVKAQSVWAHELLKSAGSDLECNFIFDSDITDLNFKEKIKQNNCDFGINIDYKCEKMNLITQSGKTLSDFEYSALTSLIIMKSFKEAVIYTPLSSPVSIEVLAEKYSATVHRTPLSPPHIMNELSRHSEKMFMHQFIYRFDAVGATILLIDFLSQNNCTIESLLSEIPPSFIVTTDVSCKKSSQENAIRNLCANKNGTMDKSKDYVKLNFDGGWALVVPCASQSVIKIISHGKSGEYAREIADICTDYLSNQ